MVRLVGKCTRSKIGMRDEDDCFMSIYLHGVLVCLGLVNRLC